MNPAIGTVMEMVAAAVEAIEPTVRARVAFRRITGSTDPRDLPADSSCERQFRVKFAGLVNAAAGPLAPELADRKAQLVVEVAYPSLEKDESPEPALAIDTELIHRAMRRGSLAPIKRTETTTAREDGGGAPTILSHAVTVTYRDQE